MMNEENEVNLPQEAHQFTPMNEEANIPLEEIDDVPKNSIGNRIEDTANKYKDASDRTYKDIAKGGAKEGLNTAKQNGISKNSLSEGLKAGKDKAVGDARDKMLGDTAGKALDTMDKARRGVQAAGHAARAITNGASALLSTITNPVFWATVIGIALVFGLLAGTTGFIQVVGKNENADGCYGIGGGSNAVIPAGTVGAKVNVDEQRNSIGSWLMTQQWGFLGNKGMTKEQAAGFVGNWQKESGLNPGNAQDVNNPEPGWGDDISNADIIAKYPSSKGGRAIGIMQWDADRRTKLVEYANSKNKPWQDLVTQLEYFKTELDGSEGQRLVAAGFGSNHTPEEFAEMVNRTFERSSDFSSDRAQNAKDFMTKFTGGGSIQTGGSCLSGGGNFDASSVVALAVSIAYPTSAESRVQGDSYGRNIAPEAYKAAKASAEQKGGKDGIPGLYASCDRFVATVVKNMLDPDIPWGSTTEQQKYLSTSPKWQRYETKAQAKPGDIWITKTNGHVILYIGDHNGKDSIAHASYLERVGAIGSANYLNANLVDTGGRAYYGYHFIGTPIAGSSTDPLNPAGATAAATPAAAPSK